MRSKAVVLLLLIVAQIVGFCNCSMLFERYFVQFCNHLDGEKRAGCFACVFLVSRDCCVTLPRCVRGLFKVCDCGIF